MGTGKSKVGFRSPGKEAVLVAANRGMGYTLNSLNFSVLTPRSPLPVRLRTSQKPRERHQEVETPKFSCFLV